MEFDEYRKQRKQIFFLQEENKETSNLLWASNSLAGEVGELANEVKKLYRNDKGEVTPERINKILDESGDVLWYLLFLVEDVVGVKLERCMEINLKKLKERYNIG